MEGTPSDEPLVEGVVRNILGRSDKMPETYLSHLITGSFDEVVPPAGVARENWVRAHVTSAFDPARASDISSVMERKAPGIGQAIEASVRTSTAAGIEKASNGTLMGSNLASMIDTVRAHTANRVVDFMKPGKRLAMRVSREASSLRQNKDETILDRLASSPESRLDDLPPSGRERTDWIRERLLAEYVSARGGVMSAQAVVAGALRARGPVPLHPIGDMPVVREEQRPAVRALVREEMAREIGMSDPVLRSRHAQLPGIESLQFPAAGRERNQTVARILMAGLVRGEMKSQQMIVPPRKERQIPVEAQTIVRYVPRSRGLGRPERETVSIAPPPAPPPREKAAVPMGGDRVSSSQRYADMVRKAITPYEF